MSAGDAVNELLLYGRSSSHFTRVTRVFAEELDVDYSFCVVRDLLAVDPASYGGHPGLKVPTLVSGERSWFGSLNVSRELARRARRSHRIAWPEAYAEPVTANAQELVLQAMNSEVALVMNRVGGGREDDAHQMKLRAGLESMLAWLERHVPSALSMLPAERELSYLEVTLFCLVTHLEFREILPLTPYAALGEFRRRFEQRASAERTSFRFDV